MAWLIARRFDAYVIDANRSEDGALGICRTIRNVDDDGALICVSDNGNGEKLLDAGADLVLKMPDDLGRLRHTIDDLLDGPKNKSGY
jgi:hypothetical protein